MSQADTELIKAVIAAFNDGDFDRMLDHCDEDVEIQRVGGLATVHGKEAIRDWLAPDAIGYQHGEPTAFRRIGEQILVRCDWEIRGRGSGIEVETGVFLLFTVRDGRITRVAVHLHEAEALKAAGLRE
jgi:ketosteroid isomerase-like protein